MKERKKYMEFTSVENDSGLMKSGEYEVYLKECKETETMAGNPVIKFEFVVRTDVDQPYQNKHMFKNFYPDRVTGKWPADKIGKYANALGIPKGEPFELYDLTGLNCIMVVKHFTTKEGEERDCIFYLKPSKVGDYVQNLKDKYQDFAKIDEIDEDMPF